MGNKISFNKIFIFILFLLITNLFAKENNSKVLFFYTENCKECQYVENNIFPKLDKNIIIQSLDVDEIDNYMYLMQLEDKFGDAGNSFPLLFINGIFLIGKSDIEKNIFKTLNKPYVPLPKIENKSLPKSLNLFSIILGGLIDGINPCVFTVIIFFISYLSYLKKDKKNIFISGLNFIFGSFISYFLIGLGVIKIVENTFILKIFILIFLFILVILSIQDIYLLYKGKKTILRLGNKSIQNIHKIIKKFPQFAFIIGFIVSLVEFPCTGQIYIPIIYLIKSQSIQGYMYLFIYNIFFILPLIILFLIVYFGLDLIKIGKFYNNNIMKVRIMLSLFYIFLFGVYIFILI